MFILNCDVHGTMEDTGKHGQAAYFFCLDDLFGAIVKGEQ